MEEPTNVRYWNALQVHCNSQEDGAEEKRVKTQRKLDMVSARDSGAMRQLASEYEGEGMGLVQQMGHHLDKMQSASDKGQAWRQYHLALLNDSDGQGVALGRNVMRAISRSCINKEEFRLRVAQYQAAKMAGEGVDAAVFDPIYAKDKYDAARLLLRDREGDRHENIRRTEKNHAKILAVVDKDAEKAQERTQSYFGKVDHHHMQYEDKMHQLLLVRGKIQGWNAKADEIDGLRERPYRYAMPPSPPSTPSSDSQEDVQSDAESE